MPELRRPARPAPVTSAFADTARERLITAYAGAADPTRAAAMAAYMKDIGPFLGIPTTARRALAKEALRGLPVPDEADCVAFALACRALPEREYRYAAVDLLRARIGRCTAAILPVVRELLVTDGWWDTVDLLAAHVVGPLATAEPARVHPVLDRWIEGTEPGAPAGSEADLWLARTAVLHQLAYKDRTDPERLFRYCARRAEDPRFFLRKGIGWALRAYAKTDPDAVTAFVAAHRDRLAPLTVREALKHLGGA
ncbi:DNA alkylation repair protein [Streptomyces sp. BI20]|uniref:DNA alkylation repair protein n=1 Tax=Streptomyces sp. BI20 TaxID=3403460 RepID=UPI003C796B3F